MMPLNLSGPVQELVNACTRAHTRYLIVQAAKAAFECPPDEKRRIEREWVERRLKLADAILTECGVLGKE